MALQSIGLGSAADDGKQWLVDQEALNVFIRLNN